nr:hypothetical protein [Tanacetum cinerariifolium]
MVKKDMRTYVSRLKDTELGTLITTYDIPLDLRPRLPDPNFRMINLPVGDTAIGIYSRIFDSSSVRIPFSSFLLAVLKYFKVHISQLVPLGLNKDHVDRLKAHIVKLRDIPEGVMVRFGLSRVWRNPMCDLMLRRSNKTVMSIHDFLCLPSLDKATVREEPHGLNTFILGRVDDHTTSPAPAGTAIPRASPEEIAITRPDPTVVTKADHTAKRKAYTRPEISTNAARRTRSSKKVCGAGSSGLAAEDEVEHIDDEAFYEGDQRDGLEFAMENIKNLNDVIQDKEVEAHAGLSEGVKGATRASLHASHGKLVSSFTFVSRDTRSFPYMSSFLYFLHACVSEDVFSPAQEAMPALDTQPLDADAGADEIASDGNVDPYYEARVINTGGDVLERDLFPSVPGPYYLPYPYDEGSGIETAFDRFLTPAEAHRLRELSSVELSDRMSVLQCQLVTHGSMLNARYDHSLRNFERLTKRCAQQTQTIKKQSAYLKQQNESIVRATEGMSRLTTKLGVLRSRCQMAEHKLTSWDKKHRKYKNKRDALAVEKATIKEKLFLKNGEFNKAFARVLNIAISVGVERVLHMDRIDEEFRRLSQKVDGFILDATEKFDRVIAAFPGTTFPFLDMTSSPTAFLGANTYIRHSTSSFGAFGHTSTPEHLKKKKKSVKKGGPSAP